MGTTSATLLFIPLTYLLTSGFACHDKKEVPFWQELGYSCYTGGHLAQTVIAAGFTLAFIALCSLFALVYFDSNPLSPNLAAKAHGRADFVVLVTKTLLVVLVEVYPHSIGHIPLTAIVAVSAIVWLGVFVYMLPFHHHLMNRLNIALAATYAWIVTCLILAEAVPGFDSAIMMYAGVPLAAASGVLVADYRAARIDASPIARLDSPYEVELKVRYYLHTVMYGHPTMRAGDMGVLGGGSTAQGVVGSGGGAGAGAATTPTATHGHSEGHGGVAVEDLDSHDDTAALAARIRAQLPPSVVAEAEAMIKAGLSRFKKSAILHIFAARFYNVFCANVHLQMS